METEGPHTQVGLHRLGRDVGGYQGPCVVAPPVGAARAGTGTKAAAE